MKKLKNLLIYLLSLVMIVSLLMPALTVTVFADEEKKELSEEDKKKEEAAAKKAEFDAEKASYLDEGYESPEAKLATMSLYFENDEYAIYGLEKTGEVGIKDKTTGQVMLTNPHDAAESMSSDAVKEQLLSQLILSYSDNSGTVVSLNSFADAAFASMDSKQITMTATRTGLRVEYTIGREAVKYVVPRQITKEAFENEVLPYFDDVDDKEKYDAYKYLTAFFTLKDPNDPKLPASAIEAMKTKWPITENYAIYVLDPAVVNREMIILEGYFMDTQKFNEYSEIEEMYELLNYVDTSAAPALFRFAIEYNLDEYGLEIKLPASSIRYDSSAYKLESVKFLPYFCAGRNTNEGFTLVPDGSGTITRFEDIGKKAFTLTGKLYGKDYSFHTISGTTQETMRLPAFGVMETREPYPEYVAPVEETEEIAETEETAEEAVDEVVENTAEALEETVSEETTDVTAEVEESTEEVAEEAVEETTEEIVEEVVEETAEEVIEEVEAVEESEAETTSAVTEGYIAYLIEGDAMAEITSDHGGTVHGYSSVYTTFYPRPTDSYVLEGISTTGDATWTVSSDRRYTGNYTMRIFPITGSDCDYTDMAEEIRNYLIENGTFEKMTAEADKSDDVPLYIETFGTVETTQKFAGFPVDVQTPLTTVEQAKEIVNDLMDGGIKNINIKYTGWFNGGLNHTAPAKLKIEKAVGGLDGFKALAKFADEKNIGIYPDIDFVYVNKSGMFDGFDYKDDSVKTIDNRSASYRKYNSLYQGFEDEGALIVSPTAMNEFYGDIKDEFAKIGAQGISVGTLGSELSSDHNEDYALNREDVKLMLSELLADIKKDNGSVMVNAGNAYALPYVDHILGVSMDSSLNINTSESIPFVGMVLHGNVEFTGTAINLDGDFEYSLLKAIENGASLYFILSKDNYSELKQFEEFSKYYAISYDNWRNAEENAIIDTYKKFNDVMKNVKYSYIVGHETLATRVVKVEYEGGNSFLLNYNTNVVSVNTETNEVVPGASEEAGFVVVQPMDFCFIADASEKEGV